jgi:hypothetical protein
VGLLGTLGDLSPETILKYDYGSYKGYVAENYVAQEFIASGRESLFCWEGRTSEIEFVISSDGYPVPIEVKAGRNTQSKSMAVFDNKYKPGLKCVISSKQLTFDKDKGIQRIPLYLTNRFPFI